MAQIFVSYAQENEPRADDLAMALRDEGWSVFRDRTIPPGQRWDEYIGRELEAARCVVVLWSEAACASNWVLEEAEDARQRGILVPALIEARLPPLGFRRIQAADLSDWTGSPDHQQFQQLVGVIRGLTPMARDVAPEPFAAVSGLDNSGATPMASDVDHEATPLEHIFVAASFCERDRDLTGNVAALLASHEIAVVSGEDLGDGALSDLVRQRIAQTDGLIALLTRREELEGGSWTTQRWVLDELVEAQALGKPTVALVEAGVQPPQLFDETQVIAYDSLDSVTALLDLSRVVGLWKSRAGRILKVSIGPADVAESLFATKPASCRYRIVLGGERSDWRVTVPIPEVGGAFLYLAVPRRDALVQVEVSDGATTWRSPVVAECVPVNLSRA